MGGVAEGACPAGLYGRVDMDEKTWVSKSEDERRERSGPVSRVKMNGEREEVDLCQE